MRCRTFFFVYVLTRAISLALSLFLMQLILQILLDQAQRLVKTQLNNFLRE